MRIDTNTAMSGALGVVGALLAFLVIWNTIQIVQMKETGITSAAFLELLRAIPDETGEYRIALGIPPEEVTGPLDSLRAEVDSLKAVLRAR